MTNMEMLKEFHDTFGRPDNAVALNPDFMGLRGKLLEEEFEEYVDASNDLAACHYFGGSTPEEIKEHTVELLDAMADMVYIIYGTAEILGLDLDEALRRVHASNMSKLGADGRPIINDGKIDPTRPVGKILKGPNYHKPNLEDLV